MTTIDLTVILTAHSETVVAGPTMRSAEAAIAQVEAAGHSVERLLAFDTPSESCRAYFAQFADWQAFEFEFRDQGATRNAAIAKASGRWIALLDADDLFSENWLVEALRVLLAAEAEGQRVIMHPELNWLFDGYNSVLEKVDQRSPLFTARYLLTDNCYDALCVSERRTFVEFPYSERALDKGFAYEDWHWAVKTMVSGIRHLTAPDTIIFKRRRDSSQTVEASGKSARIRLAEGTAIDQLGKEKVHG